MRLGRAGGWCLPARVWVVVLAALCTVASAAEAVQRDPSDGKAAQLLSCLPRSCVGKRTHWEHMAGQRPPCLAAQQLWWSRVPPRLPITLVTQLSINRLPALQAQCQQWAGPLAAAVYVSLLAPGVREQEELSAANKQRLQAAVNSINQLMNWAEEMAVSSQATAAKLALGQETESLDAVAGGYNSSSSSKPRASCQLRVILMYELLAQERAVALYPVNSLRNYARLMADTPLIANIDVDMLPSFSLSAALIRGWPQDGQQTAGASAFTPGSAGDLMDRMKREKSVYVVPAFETFCGGPTFADEVAAYSKGQLQGTIDENCTAIFRRRVAPQCHNATNFPAWFELPSTVSPDTAPYKIQYEDTFEPWFISDRAQTEWYDVRYRGYGKNKIEQVAHTAYRDNAFYVHPTGFIVHRPHDQSQARKAFIRVKFKSRTNVQLLQDSLFKHIEDMWAQHVVEIKAGTFQAMIDDVNAKCLEELPWWKSVYSQKPAAVKT